MKPLGIIFLILSALAGRAGIRGRALSDISGDVKDGTKALVTGNFTELQAVYSREGTLSVDSAGGTTSAGGSGNGSVLVEMQRLGTLAKGYRLGSVGQLYYDCSGLVYAAMKSLGIYTGLRFSTATFPAFAASKITRVPATDVQTGDIVLWQSGLAGHMGAVDGQDSFYSALNPTKGLVSMSTSQFTKSYKVTPSYWRVKP